MALGNLGHGAFDRGDVEEARRLHQEQLTLARAIGHRRSEARALGACAIDAKHLGLLDEAERTYERYIAVSQEIDHRMGVAYGKVNLARLLGREGEFERARRLLREGEEILAASNPSALGHLREILGEVEEGAGRPEEARAAYRESLAHYARAGNDAGRAAALRLLGALDGDATALDEALAIARRLDLAGTAVEAACARAALPGGDATAAAAGYDEAAPRLALLARMDAAYALYRLTGGKERIEEARLLLGRIEEHVPEPRRAGWRAHPLQARIIALPPGPPPS
jgi:tetratricopeptide (TPR) repeat protein